MTGCLHLPSGRRLLPDACCGYNRPRSRRCPPRSPPYLCVLPCEVRHPGARSLVCPGLTPGRGDARPPWGSVLHDAPESTARRPPTPTDGAARFPDAAHSGQSSFARRRAGFAARAEGYTPPGGPPVGRSELEVETHRRGLEPDVTHRKSQRRKRVRVSPLGDTLVPSRPEPGPLHARMSVPSVTFGRKPRARVCMGGGAFPFVARPCGLPLAPSGLVIRNGRASPVPPPPGHLWNVPPRPRPEGSSRKGGTRYRSASPAWILISRSLKNNLTRKQTQRKQKRSRTDTRATPAPDSLRLGCGHELRSGPGPWRRGPGWSRRKLARRLSVPCGHWPPEPSAA